MGEPEDKGPELRPRPFVEKLKGTTVWLLGLVALAVIWLLGWVMFNTSERQAARRAARENPEVSARAEEGLVPAFLQRDPAGQTLVATPPPLEPITIPAFVEHQPTRGARGRREQPDIEELARMSGIVPEGWRGAGRGGATPDGGIPPPGAVRAALLEGLESSPASAREPHVEAPGPDTATPILASAAPRATMPVLPRGAVIPVTMARAVQTDGGCYPSAVVRRAVYSRDGELLIAAGALMHGECEGAMVFGARRLFVRWDRIDLPDGTRLDLSAGLPSGALDGSLGTEGKLKTHFWRALRDAALISVVAAGAQLAQPEGARTSDGFTITDRQLVAAAVAQELSRVAVEQLRRNLSRTQTIVVEEGARFNVVLHRDLVFGGIG